MAGLKEIRRRLKSVKNTKKITYAMKLVSAAKLRKAQESVTRSRDYTNAINALLAELVAEQGGAGFSHPLMHASQDVKNVRVLVIGGSRGLCGGYNSNVNKQIMAFKKERTALQQSLSWIAVGKKPAEFMRREKIQAVATYEDLSEDANQWPIEEICFGFEKAFIADELDEVHLIFTHFRSAISMQAKREKLLPLEQGLSTEAADSPEAGAEGITLFEPSPQEVFATLLPRIVRAKVRQAALDSKASEQGSRMTAMDSATKNAGDLIERLTLTHNKLRQAGITSELLDIIGGAEASN